MVEGKKFLTSAFNVGPKSVNCLCCSLIYGSIWENGMWRWPFLGFLPTALFPPRNVAVVSLPNTLRFCIDKRTCDSRRYNPLAQRLSFSCVRSAPAIVTPVFHFSPTLPAFCCPQKAMVGTELETDSCYNLPIVYMDADKSENSWRSIATCLCIELADA